jgi:hypothetical protein
VPYLETIRRAFVSYSREDQRFVDRLARDLRKSAFELWVDFEGLQPALPIGRGRFAMRSKRVLHFF